MAESPLYKATFVGYDLEAIRARPCNQAALSFLSSHGPPYIVATTDRRFVRYSRSGTRIILADCTLLVLRRVTRAEYVTRYPECAEASLREAGWYEVLVD